MSTLFDIIELEQENVGEVIKALSVKCDACRLSLTHPFNRGFIYRGNPLGRIAVVYEAPRGDETERGTAMVGGHGRAFERWMRFLGLNTTEDVFVTSSVQCQPPIVEKNGEKLQREPDGDELGACFGPRCLRVLRAMPNLKAVICMGWTAAGALLGTGEGQNEKPKTKSHDAMWFETSYLPGIPVFCMNDPVWATHKPSPEKYAVIERALEFFKREFLADDRITELAAEARAGREERGEGLL